MTTAQLMAEGEVAAGKGDFTAAAASFRSASYSKPEHPWPYFELAIALEEAGNHDEARRALQTAQNAISCGDASRFEAELGGCDVSEMSLEIRRRLARAS